LASKKILGVIGGMGPHATAYLYNKIIEMTNAVNDHEHIELFLHNNTKIPDRTKAILNCGESPLNELLRSAQLLESIGVDVLLVPCITSHYFMDELQSLISIPIINAIDQTSYYIIDRFPKIKQVGILATTGTIKSKIFQECLRKNDLKSIIPNDDDQSNLIMSSIYGDKGIKAGCKDHTVKSKLLKASENLINDGAEAIIAGCTEIPLVIEQNDFKIPFINTIEIMAQAAVKRCL
jgi:aspartate racemase